MKKILIIFLLVFLIGCTKKPTDQELKDTLLDYGKSIYESDSFKIDDSKEKVYYLTLKTLESIGKDITIFNKRNCNLETTQINLKLVNDNDEMKYTYVPILDCKN